MYPTTDGRTVKRKLIFHDPRNWDLGELRVPHRGGKREFTTVAFEE